MSEEKAGAAQENATLSSSKGVSQRARSKEGFPYNDLDSTIEIARAVFERGGCCDSAEIAAVLDMEPTGGGFRLKLLSAKIFGVVDYQRGTQVSLTDIGKRLLEPELQERARVDAFLHVSLYRQFYEKYKASTLPSPQGIESALVMLGVGENVKDRARQVLMKSAEQAGFFNTVPNRLVQPIVLTSVIPQDASSVDIVDAKIETKEDEVKNTIRSNYFIQGLLEKLPKENSEWSFEERERWLKLAEMAFSMIYRRGENDSDLLIQISIVEKEGGSKKYLGNT